MTWLNVLRQFGRDVVGVTGSFTLTTLVFVAAPVCGLMWSQTPAHEEVLIEYLPRRAPVQLALGFEDDAGLEGEGAELTEDSKRSEERGESEQAQPEPQDEAVAQADSAAPESPLGTNLTPPTDLAIPGPTSVTQQGGVKKRTTLVLRPGVDAKGAGDAMAKAAAARDRALANKHRRSKKCDPSHPEVAPIANAHWSVTRKTVDYYTSSIKRFNSLGWSGPYDSDETHGWKIGGFSCNSPLYHAGLRRGDVILTVNDKPTRTWLQVFGLYRKLRRHNQFRVVLLRKGEQKVLEYTLV